MHEPIARWPLESDARDAVGANHGVARNITFLPEGAVLFNGSDSAIEVADAPAVRLAGPELTVSAWVKCTTPMRGPFGDLFSKFDPAVRCGLNLGVAGSAPGYNAMCDTRHVHFGIDDGYIGPWEDCGKPWPSNTLVSDLVAFEGCLYAAITDADKPEDAAKVFRWAKGTEWVDCGRLGQDPGHLSAMSLLVHAGRLYAGTGVWDWGRARPGQAGAFHPALSRVFVYEGGATWRDLGQVGESVRVLSLASFGGDLYAGLDRAGGGHVHKWDGARWTDCGALTGDNVECLSPFGGVLYASTHKVIFRYEGGTRWENIGDQPHGITQIHAMRVFDGRLHIGTWPQGYVLRYEGGRKWVNTGRIGLPPDFNEINEINDLTVHNGKLYAGVLPKSQVWRYESDGHWTLLGSLARRPDWDVAKAPTWGRVTCMASFQGRLFAATGACKARAIDRDPADAMGRVLACEIGQVVSHEHDIGGDWTHLAAVRQGRELRLYVNGTRRAASCAPAGRDFHLGVRQPLRIGGGEQGVFDGAIADVRLYDRALDDGQVRQLNISGRNARG